MRRLADIPRRGLAALAALALLATALPAAAQPNGLRVELSPFAGAVVHDDEGPLEDDLLVGGRLGLWINSFVGVEGSFNYNPTTTRTLPRGDVNFYAAGADLVLNLAPEGSPLVPYLTGGMARSWYDADGTTEAVEVDGFSFGGGVKLLVHEGSTSRTTLRFDFRDITVEDADQEVELGTANSRLHNLFGSAGISIAFGANSAKDSDGDGVLDKLDDCPGTPLGALVDAKGCPLDSDWDAVYDGLDQCPSTPRGALVDQDGCPLDGDGDGIADGLDKCPETPAGARVDKDGCAIDGDGDGVPDGLDQCEQTPSGATVDAQGCPLDGDGDGVFDGLDECPDTPAGDDVDPRGCTISQQEKEFLDTGTLRLNDINFASNSATLQPGSYGSLDEVGGILEKWPQLRIEIGGHTDSRGSESHNQQLSQQRAQSVLDYLLKKFEINSRQFTVVGYGESQPVADNSTAEGRLANRRVEFRILNRGVLEKETGED